MPEDINKYKDIFLSEARDHVDSMNRSLLNLEKTPHKEEFVNDIFRDAHTLKSMAAAMKYDNVSRLCHAMEDVLDAIKKKKIRPDMCFDLLFECFDILELTLKELDKGSEEPDTTTLVEKLRVLSTIDEGRLRLSRASGSERGKMDEGRESTEGSKRPTTLTVEKITSIEVKVKRLDLLMNLAEELLINKMRLDGIKENLQHPELTVAVDALGRLITDVQYNVMQSRLVPIGFVFNRFPRMVRDLAKQQNKEVNLQMEGSDIELDRTVIDEIGESLVHLLRNAIDHGIERAEERVKSGKPPEGTIKLTAARTKGFAVIEVADDGAGLDFDHVRNTAAERGIITPQATKEEVVNSIFSGVSTTKQVTAVSGRGFGLNIVKNKIEYLGGAIKVESESKKGATFAIEIPLTLAIIKAMFVEVGGIIYAIPLASIERLVNVSKSDIKGMVNYEAIVLNEEEIPITRLNVLLNPPLEKKKNPHDPPLKRGETRLSSVGQGGGFDRLPIVIIRKGGEKLGLAADAFMDTQEIVVKPLNKIVRENRYLAGSTIIGSGDVVLLLDVDNLVLTKRQWDANVRESNTNGRI